MCLLKDTESSPLPGTGCVGDCVIPGLFFLGDCLGVECDFVLLTGVLRNSLNLFFKEVTMAPYRLWWY